MGCICSTSDTGRDSSDDEDEDEDRECLVCLGTGRLCWWECDECHGCFTAHALCMRGSPCLWCGDMAVRIRKRRRDT